MRSPGQTIDSAGKLRNAGCSGALRRHWRPKKPGAQKLERGRRSRFGLAGVISLALPLALALPFAFIASDRPALAQSGGGAGGGGAGSAGGAASGGVGSGAATGSGSTASPGGATSPGEPTSAPPTATPSTGPQSRSPTPRPSTVPQVETAPRRTPSAGNAEPNSPIYRDSSPRDFQSSDPLNPRGITDPEPQLDDPAGGSGGSSSGRGDAAGGDSLMPVDPSGHPAELGSGRKTDSISDEPNRVTRGGGGAAGKNFQECMGFWRSDTHMTKSEWRETCKRLER